MKNEYLVILSYDYDTSIFWTDDIGYWSQVDHCVIIKNPNVIHGDAEIFE